MPQNIVYKSLQQRPQICMRGIVIPVVRLSCGSEVVDFNIYSVPQLPLRWLAKSFWPALHSAFGPQGGDGLKFLHLLIKLHGCDRRAKPAGGAPSILLTCEYN